MLDPANISDYDPNHKLSFVEATEGDCISGGSDSYYKCDYCGKTFEDKDGKKEVNAEDLKPHKYSPYFSWVNTQGTPGHWGPDDQYVPTDASFRVTVEFRCKVCGRIEESVPAKVTYEGESPNDSGMNVATATVTFKGKTYTDKKEYINDDGNSYRVTIANQEQLIVAYYSVEYPSEKQGLSAVGNSSSQSGRYFDAVLVKAPEPEEGMKFDGWYTCREYMDTSTGSIVWKYEKLNKVSNELEFLYFFNQQQTYLIPCYVKDDSVKEENPLVTSLSDQVKYVGYWDSAANVGRTYIDETAGTIQVTSVLRWELKQTLNDKTYTLRHVS